MSIHSNSSITFYELIEYIFTCNEYDNLITKCINKPIDFLNYIKIYDDGSEIVYKFDISKQYTKILNDIRGVISQKEFEILNNYKNVIVKQISKVLFDE